jgi:hypothetical protein
VIDHRQVLSREELKATFREAVREELAMIGLAGDDWEDRERIRDDVRFMRRMRLAMNGVAVKLGYAIILSIAGAIISIFILGLQAKLKL